MGRQRRSFSKDFKLEAVRLVKEGGLGIGRAAKDLGVCETSLRRWVKQYEIDEGKSPSGALTTAEKEELRRLRREVRTLRMEREVPKKRRFFSPRKASEVRVHSCGKGLVPSDVAVPMLAGDA